MILQTSPANSDKPEIIGFRTVGNKFDDTQENDDKVSEEVVIAELFHGPTLAFKVVVSRVL